MLMHHHPNLAIFDGDPAFKEKLHVGRPNLGNRARFVQRMSGLLDRCWLTNNGPLVQEFERETRTLLGRQALHSSWEGVPLSPRLSTSADPTSVVVTGSCH